MRSATHTFFAIACAALAVAATRIEPAPVAMLAWVAGMYGAYQAVRLLARGE